MIFHLLEDLDSSALEHDHGVRSLVASTAPLAFAVFAGILAPEELSNRLARLFTPEGKGEPGMGGSAKLKAIWDGLRAEGVEVGDISFEAIPDHVLHAMVVEGRRMPESARDALLASSLFCEPDIAPGWRRAWPISTVREDQLHEAVRSMWDQVEKGQLGDPWDYLHTACMLRFLAVQGIIAEQEDDVLKRMADYVSQERFDAWLKSMLHVPEQSLRVPHGYDGRGFYPRDLDGNDDGLLANELVAALRARRKILLAEMASEFESVVAMDIQSAVAWIRSRANSSSEPARSVLLLSEVDVLAKGIAEGDGEVGEALADHIVGIVGRGSDWLNRLSGAIRVLASGQDYQSKLRRYQLQTLVKRFL